MMSHALTTEKLVEFERKLREEEYGAATVEKYMRELRFFQEWISGRAVSKETAGQFKAYLQNESFAPATVNAKLSALNVFFRFAGWDECRLKFLRIQRQLFRNRSKELRRDEYERLLKAARGKGKEKLALLMETICGTGIRVSEVSYITVEAVVRGSTEVNLKGKVRVIFFSGKAMPEIEKIRKRARDCFRPDFPDGKRKRNFEKADMAGNERFMQERGGRGGQSVSSQSPPFVCHGIL